MFVAVDVDVAVACDGDVVGASAVTLISCTV